MSTLSLKYLFDPKDGIDTCNKNPRLIYIFSRNQRYLNINDTITWCRICQENLSANIKVFGFNSCEYFIDLRCFSRYHPDALKNLISVDITHT